jgi:hypothetical protein
MRKLITLAAIAAMITGCVTVTYPDGRTETKIDPNAIVYAEAAVHLAILAYNAYQAGRPADAPSTPRLTELLDNVERAIAIYNRLAPAFDAPVLAAVVDDNGAIILE